MENLDWMKANFWTLVATGEGAGSVLVTGRAIPMALHDFMCYCGKTLEVCKEPAVLDQLEDMKDSDNWSDDERGNRFQFSFKHEMGALTITRIDKVQPE